MKFFRTALTAWLALALAACFDPALDKPDAGKELADTLALSPGVLTLPIGTEAALTLTVTSAAGNTRDATLEAEWSVEPAGAVTVQAGKVQAVAAGSASVIARLGDKSARALVTVPAATVESLAIEPATGDTGVGGSLVLSAVATMSDQARLDVTGQVAWAATPSNVGAIASGVFRGLAPGKATVTVALGGKSASASFTVRDARLLAIAIKPAAVTLPVGGSSSLRVEGTYDDGLTADLTLAATWSASGAAVKVDEAGKVSALSAGTGEVVVKVDALAATATVTVTQATLTAITVSPSSINLPVGGQTALFAEARFSDGSTSDFTEQAVWTSSEPAKVSVSNAAGTRGKVSALAGGSATVTARFGAISGAAQLMVTASVLTALAVTPASATLLEQTELQLSAKGTYSDGTVADVTSVVSWSSLSGAVATVSPGGKLTGVTPGTTQVLAVLGGAMAQVPVTVTANTILYIAVLPGNVTIGAGATSQLRAMARRADNTLRDVTDLATWSTTNASFVTVGSAAADRGLVRGVTAGSAQVEASLQGLKGSATVTVSAPTVVALVVSPPVLRMPVGYEFLSASLAKSDGTSEEVGGTAVWSSSNPQVAEVEVYDGYAYVIAKVPGTATITASAQGKSASCAVTVTNATLTQIQISPATPQLQLGASQKLVATGIYSDFSSVNLTWYATWTSSQPAVAQVDNSQFSYDRGKVSSLSAGSTVITVNFNGVTGSTAITVTPATLTRIQVAPFAPKIPVGFDTYMRATGIFSDNTTRDLSYEVAWSSSVPGTASVDPYGRLAPHAAGVTTVRANYLGVVGSTDVTVTNATLSSVAITPANVSIAVQATQLLKAMGTFSDGTTMEVTWYVTWLSSQPAVADVRNDYPWTGELKGLSPGTTAITAVRGSVQGTAQVTVP